MESVPFNPNFVKIRWNDSEIICRRDKVTLSSTNDEYVYFSQPDYKKVFIW